MRRNKRNCAPCNWFSSSFSRFFLLSATLEFHSNLTIKRIVAVFRFWFFFSLSPAASLYASHVHLASLQQLLLLLIAKKFRPKRRSFTHPFTQTRSQPASYQFRIIDYVLFLSLCVYVYICVFCGGVPWQWYRSIEVFFPRPFHLSSSLSNLTIRHLYTFLYVIYIFLSEYILCTTFRIFRFSCLFSITWRQQACLCPPVFAIV